MPLDRTQLFKPLKKLKKLVNNINWEPTPEEVHGLRSNARRFEAISEALSLDGQEVGKAMLKYLPKFRKRAGKVRDMDVLTGYASTVHAPGEEECAVQLLEYLGAQRPRRAKRLYAEVKQHRKRVRAGLKRTPAVLTKRIRQNGNNQSGGAAASHAAATAVELAVQLAAPHRLGRENLHLYRLKVKELRNVLQLASGSSRPEFVEDLKHVKDAIGEWHDWEELVLIAQKALNHGKRCGLLAELKRTAEGKYDHALALTKALRKKYLSDSHSSGKGASSAGPAVPRPPVWDAIARLA